jgi:dihydroorotate dehydrogenase electron transfer subunit
VRRKLTVLGNRQLGAYNVLRLADPAGSAPQPGQFSMLATVADWGGGGDERPHLPRAFSVARWQDGEAHYLLEDVGPGTHRLCELRAGEEVWALGPLGRGFDAPEAGRRAILVGGGVGIAPLAILQDLLLQRRGAVTAASMDAAGSRDAAQASGAPRDSRGVAQAITVLLGFRDGAHAYGAELLRDAQIATDDGTVGHRGLVTDLLAHELDEDPAAVVYACGPAPMLEATRAMCAERGVPARLALESGMACGFGACFGCVVPTRDGYVRVCVDGPVIDAARLEHVDAHAGAPA